MTPPATLRFPRPLLAILFAALSSTTGSAQSLNIDIQATNSLGNPSGAVPPSVFGGNADQFGVWNDWRPGTFGQPMVAIDGSVTPVLMSWTSSTPLDFMSFTSMSPFPGFDPLMGDFLEASWFASSGEYLGFNITGLSAGTYDVYTYAGLWNCAQPNTVSIATPGSIDPPQAVEGFARHRVTVTSGTIEIHIRPATQTCAIGWMVDCQGMQLVKLGEPTSICAGDGSGTPCPCGNAGAAGRGCANSFEPLGARLAASGTASVTADDLVLSASGVSNATATFFQGSVATNNGAGAAFGDGLRCAGGSVVRIAARAASANQVAYPGAFDPPLGTIGGGQAAGSERIYQVWYRNAASFCTTSTFNLTNGVRAVWSP